MTRLPKSTTDSLFPWSPAAGFALLGAPALAGAAEESEKTDSTAPKEEASEPAGKTKEIVGTSTLQPGPETITQGNWKPLAVGAAIFFLTSAFMCALIFKLYTKRQLV
ncbi:MAG: hypothetical protein AAGJ79_14185 [Verrucomicrobiota bacterium]